MSFKPIPTNRNQITFPPLKEAVLHLFKESKVLSEAWILEQFPQNKQKQVISNLKQLESSGFIRSFNGVDAAINGEVIAQSKKFELLALGSLHINRGGRASTIYNHNENSFNQNSAIANNSHNVSQNVQISAMDEETKQLILRLEEAIDKKDGDAISSTIRYILDKGLDVGLTVVTQVLMKSQGLA